MISKSIIKYIQSLQHKKFRDEFNCFHAEGPKVVKELLSDNKFECLSIYALEIWIKTIDRTVFSHIEQVINVVEEHELSKISQQSTSNNVIAVFKKREDNFDIVVKNNFTIMLENIQDPGNMGTIIRTADWFGVKNIICSENTVDLYNNKVVQSTMASLGRVNVVYTNLANWLKSNHDVKVIATVLNGKSLNSISTFNEAIIMIGNEANGLSQELIDISDEKVSIPRIGMAESLNAGIATSIFLYELNRKR